MKKKILINALSAQQGGGRTYLLNLFPHFNIENVEIEMLVSPLNEKTFNELQGIRLTNIQFWGMSVLKRTLWETFLLPRYLKKNKIDILFSPGGIVPLFLFSSEIKLVTTCQNMLPFLPSQIINAENWKLKIKFILLFFVQSLSFKKSDLVIFLSEYAKEAVSKKIGLKNNSVIIPHGLNSLFWEKTHSIQKNEGDFILYVSSFFKYKSQDMLLKAWKILKSSYPNLQTKLIFIGDHSSDFGKEIYSFAKRENLLSSVSFLGLIPYQQIPNFTQSSKLNIFASTCENCPNILLEYMASNKPVLCSITDPMPEFAKNTVIYYDPMDINDTVKKLENILINNQYDLKAYADNAFIESKNYSWEKTREKTWKSIYNLI